MLKVSEDGKNLVNVGTGRADVWWVHGWLRVRLAEVAPEDLQTLAAFIQAGPPKRWRITRTFDEMPSKVVVEACPHYGNDIVILEHSDVEEV